MFALFICMKRFLVIIEESKTGFAAYSPDLPGCIATGETREEVETLMYEAMQFHLEGLKEEGLPVPEGKSFAEFMVLPETASA